MRLTTKRAGLVGGLGPESTIDYYRRIIDSWKARFPGTYPELLIDSLDVDHGLRLVREDRAALADYIAASVERLARAGCDFAAITANTPHIVFDDVARTAPIPLISIVATCAAEAQRLGLRRVGLLGTGFTMEAELYPSVFARAGVEVHVPDAGERAWLHERYIGELLNGVFHDATRDGVVRLVEGLRERHDIEAVVVAGTELPLLIRSGTVPGLMLLDTTELHVRSIIDAMAAPQPANVETRDAGRT